MNLSEIKEESMGTLDLLLKSMQEVVSPKGSRYIVGMFADLSGKVQRVNIFDEKYVRDIIPPAPVVATVEVKNYNGNRAYAIKGISKSNLTQEDFLPKANINPQEAWKKMFSILGGIQDKKLGKFVCDIIRTNVDGFRNSGLSSEAFDRRCGVLEATVNLLEIVSFEADRNPDLDRDIMLAGAALYFIGSVGSLDENYDETDRSLALSPSLRNYAEIIRMEAVTENDDLPDEGTLLHLEHIVTREDDTPATLEAFIVSHLGSYTYRMDRAKKIIKGIPLNGNAVCNLNRRSPRSIVFGTKEVPDGN